MFKFKASAQTCEWEPYKNGTFFGHYNDLEPTAEGLVPILLPFERKLGASKRIVIQSLKVPGSNPDAC